MQLSLVITLLNEQDNIAPLLQRISTALSNYTYEVILVDDGSTDQTVQRIKTLADEHIVLLIFRRNYGQTAAMKAGIDYAKGDYIITLDGDLQNDPSDIPMMVQKLESEDLDMVAGRRANRQDGMVLRKIPSKIANALIRRMTGVYVHDYGCSLKVMRKEIAKNLGLYGQLHRYVPVLANLQGARIAEVDVQHHARIHGTSKYGLGRTFKVISDLLLMLFFQQYQQRPMHLFGPIGIFSFLGGTGILGYMLLLKLLGNDIWGRPLLLLGMILLIAGIQLLTFGIMAEIMMRTYYESQDKSPYRIRSVYQKNSPHQTTTL
ncbi:MAG: glycosyltransferase family 2 protein [Chitinophagales bacterium]|nr:glycosyltransferase family 2 protein [Chitinophagales bacterium]